jgi:hypothetical protein
MEEFVSDTFPQTLDDFTVMLRIRHPSIDPDEITSKLGLEPQHSWKAGETRRTAQGTPLEGAYRESFWTGEFHELETGLKGVVETEAALMAAVVQLRRSQAFLSKLQAEGGTVELYRHSFCPCWRVRVSRSCWCVLRRRSPSDARPVESAGAPPLR